MWFIIVMIFLLVVIIGSYLSHRECDELFRKHEREGQKIDDREKKLEE